MVFIKDTVQCPNKVSPPLQEKCTLESFNLHRQACALHHVVNIIRSPQRSDPFQICFKVKSSLRIINAQHGTCPFLRICIQHWLFHDFYSLSLMVRPTTITIQKTNSSLSNIYKICMYLCVCVYICISSFIQCSNSAQQPQQDQCIGLSHNPGIPSHAHDGNCVRGSAPVHVTIPIWVVDIYIFCG